MSDKKAKDYGCFLLIALICGAIVFFSFLTSLIKELAYQTKHNPERILMIVFVIGVVSFFIYKSSDSNN